MLMASEEVEESFTNPPLSTVRESISDMFCEG